MTKTLNTPPGGYLIFKNDVWAGSIPTDWPSRPNLENLHALRQGVGGRPPAPAAILEWRTSSAFQVGDKCQTNAVPAATILHA